MNIKQAKEQIKNAMTAYFTKDETGAYELPAHQQRPVFLMGPPGIGKTAIMEQVASEMDVALLSYSMTHHTRQSALGLPFIVHKSYQGGAVECDVSEYTMSEIIASIYDIMEKTGKREGILFLDEINCVSETLSPVMLQFLQYKVFGRHKVPDGWIVVTAGNPPEYNNSVREFDIVTWDRLKRIDIEPDLNVWKEYARNSGVHPAVLTYLDVRSEDFYKVESTVDGKRFVTARGWEDLSRIIRLYEKRGIEVDHLLIEQYLQDKKIARDFSQYYILFNKYKSDYQVDSILSGNASAKIKARAAKAKFDERLALISLMLDMVRTMAYDTMCEHDTLKLLTSELKGMLKSGKDICEGLTSAAAAASVRLETGRSASSLSRRDARVLTRLGALYTDLSARAQDAPAGRAASVKANHGAMVTAFNERVKALKASLGNMYAFAAEVFGTGQELLIITTELTGNRDTAAFIARFGCDEYFHYNKELLLYERQDEIRRALEELGLD